MLVLYVSVQGGLGVATCNCKMVSFNKIHKKYIFSKLSPTNGSSVNRPKEDVILFPNRPCSFSKAGTYNECGDFTLYVINASCVEAPMSTTALWFGRPRRHC